MWRKYGGYELDRAIIRNTHLLRFLKISLQKLDGSCFSFHLLNNIKHDGLMNKWNLTTRIDRELQELQDRNGFDDTNWTAKGIINQLQRITLTEKSESTQRLIKFTIATIVRGIDRLRNNVACLWQDIAHAVGRFTLEAERTAESNYAGRKLREDARSKRVIVRSY